MENRLKLSIRLIPIEEIKKATSLKEKVGEIIKGNEEDFPGLLRNWDKDTPGLKLYIIYDNGAKPLGLIGWSADAADPKWWVHRDYERKGVGTDAARLLAQEMVSKGVERISDSVRVDEASGKREGANVASGKLVCRLREEFRRLKGLGTGG